MRDHPIPQDVVGYRFHIIGNMTIKQFAEIGFGCVIAFLIYSTNLFSLFKWPLIGLSIGLGALAAFVPFEERPLDHWLVTFIRVMYKPTLFYWRREPKIPDAFLYTPSQQTPKIAELDLTPARRQRIKDYLGSLDQTTPPDQFELTEQSRLQEIMMTFQTFGAVGLETRGPHRPTLTLSTHSLKEPESFESDLGQQDQPSVNFEIPNTPIAASTTEAANKQLLSVHQVASTIEIPEYQNIKVENNALQTDEASVLNANQAPIEERAYSTSSSPITEQLASQPASLNADLPFPVRPTEPNKIVGMVLSPMNELLNDAIVEIKSEAGVVARAIKTNALGQFFVTTPLESGTYTLTVEKDGYQFLPLSLTLTGTAVDPIEVRSL